MSIDADNPHAEKIAWYEFPYSYWPDDPLLHEPLDEHSPSLPKHHPTVEQIALVKTLGLNPRDPKFERLRGKLLQMGLPSDDLPTLSVDAILEVLKPAILNRKRKRAYTPHTHTHFADTRPPSIAIFLEDCHRLTQNGHRAVLSGRYPDGTPDPRYLSSEALDLLAHCHELACNGITPHLRLLHRGSKQHEIAFSLLEFGCKGQAGQVEKMIAVMGRGSTLANDVAIALHETVDAARFSAISDAAGIEPPLTDDPQALKGPEPGKAADENIASARGDAAAKPESSDKNRMSVQEVASRMERLRGQGEEYTSQRDFASKFGCSPTTVCKATKQTPELEAWSKKTAVSPKAGSIDGKVIRETAQSSDPDPADDAAIREHLERDDLSSDERAWFNALSTKDQIAFLNDPDRHQRILGRKA